MTKIQSAIVALALVAGAGTVAQAQSASVQPGASAGRVGSDSTWKRGRAEGGRGMKGRSEMRGAFRGVKLTDAQKTQMKAIGARYQPQYKPLMESMKPAMTEARTARQRGDTAAARAAFARTADTRAKLEALHLKQRAEVRGILTAEQQKAFDSNLANRKEHGGRGHGREKKQG